LPQGEESRSPHVKGEALATRLRLAAEVQRPIAPNPRLSAE